MTKRTWTTPGLLTVALAPVRLALNALATGVLAVTRPLLALHHRARLLRRRVVRFWDPSSDIETNYWRSEPR